ncbi:putative nuclease HARBI1 isoform X1 [Prorops nasuta]|uniref:putative nuclease HARBI1 isoform X1 n=1 Tax=Prorops nasuta TaxID=863751 RepID=UPI0034CECA48
MNNCALYQQFNVTWYSSDTSSEEDEYQVPTIGARTYIRDVMNPFEAYDEQNFHIRYRFSKYSVMHGLLPLVNSSLQKFTKKGLPIDPIIQLLICLRFYATASFQKVIGDLIFLSQPTVSRIVFKISVILASKLHTYIKFPRNEESIQENRRLFNRLGYGNGAIGLPNIEGAIDCTHIRLGNNNFSSRAESYRNRKGYFSLNVQAIVGPRMEFLDLVPEFPGREHVSSILQNSRIFIRYQQRELTGMLVGDAGYPSLTFLLTPFRNPQSEEEERYNIIQSRTRMIVERTFGVWKRRFPCLSKGLALNINTCTAVVAACGVLHNLTLQYNDILVDILDNENEDDLIVEDEYHRDEPGDGCIIRRNIVQQMFG